MTKKYFYSLAILFTIFHGASNAQIINTVVGTFTGDGYTARSIGINPVGQAMDAAGNLYIAVPDRHVVVKLSTAGIYSTVAGSGIYGFKGDGGPATSAQLKNPWKVAVDASGNVYIADNYDHRIRKVSASGIITTIAGTGAAGFSGDGGPATAARLSGAVAIEVDKAGNLFIADYVNRRIRKITPAGIISTIAGTGASGRGGDNGPAKSAPLGYVSAIALNSAGEVFIGDNTFGVVRKVNASGIITTVAGTGSQGFSGDGGLATTANFRAINGLAVDKSGNIFIADTYNNRVRKVGTNGIVTTIAGTGGTGFSGDGAAATAAQVKEPRNVAVDNAGNVLISSNFRVRKVTVSSGIITTIAGNGSGGFCGDGGSVTKAQTYHPLQVTADGSGNLFIIERENHRVRKVRADGTITTLAGNGTAGFSGDGGPADRASLNLPTSVAVDKAGNVFITEFGNHRIRKVSASGIITTLAGTGSGGWNGDGVATGAKIFGPDGVAVDSLGNVFFADQYNNRIRKITTGGAIITIAGTGSQGSSGDGGSALLAKFWWPNNVKVDKAGNVYICDRRNYRVRKVSTTGIITTVAGTGSQRFNGDGKQATLAAVDVIAIAVDGSGNLFISDKDNERIRRVNSSGIISTLAGGSNATYGDGGVSTSAQIHTPQGIATDASGNLYITDYDNHRVRKIALAGVPLSRSSGKATISDIAESTPLKFSVYPNPVQNTLYIQTTRGADVKNVEVIDATGKILLSKKVDPSQSVITVQLGRLTPGSYLIRTIGRDNSISVKEIIKQ